MLALRAVDPHGLGVIDHDGVGWDIGGIGGDGHETREDAGKVRMHVDGLTGVIEVGLGDGVVLWHELELHHVTLGRDDIIGPVSQAAVRVADGDDVDVDTATAAAAIAVAVAAAAAAAAAAA